MSYQDETLEIEMRRGEVEALIALIQRQQEFLTNDESGAMERLQDAMMLPRKSALIGNEENEWDTGWLSRVGSIESEPVKSGSKRRKPIKGL